MVSALGPLTVSAVDEGLKSSTETLIGTSSEITRARGERASEYCRSPAIRKGRGRPVGVGAPIAVAVEVPRRGVLRVVVPGATQRDECQCNTRFSAIPRQTERPGRGLSLHLLPTSFVHDARPSKSDLMTHRLQSRAYRFEQSVLAARLHRWGGNIATGDHMDITK